jgi:isopentenyl-diphosphate delta-isomerase
MASLILVNEKDEAVGFATKEECHKGKGILHRAFSVYIFNDKSELLIQQRSKEKLLWPGFWSNSCCSHPRAGEDYEKAGERRLKEELGFSCPLKLLNKFQYQAQYKDIGSENEVCAVLVGHYQGKVEPAPEEAADFKWISLAELKKDIVKNPDRYTPWFKIALKFFHKF